jgi:hypothetical protein
MKKILFSLVAMLLLSVSGFAQTTYTKVTSTSGLEAGANYLIVAHHDDFGALAMGYQKSNNRNAVVVSEDGESITVTPGTNPDSETDVFQFTLGGSTGAWTLFDEVKGGYLYASSSSSNQLKTQNTNNANGEWSIVFNADGTAEVVAQGDNTRNNMRFNPNNGTPLFSCYAETSSVDTRVSFYKAGGDPVPPVPEPCDYPSSFAVSHVEGVDVTLEWYDAPCEVKYLVLASTGSITVPIDGMPVSDDLLAKNVDYSVETVTFSGLQGNTHYNFAIFPYTNSGASIDYLTSGDYPTAEATTEDIFYLLNEDFEEEDFDDFSPYDMYGDQSWRIAIYDGNSYANMNGYASGSAHTNEDWLISKVMSGAYQTILLQFRTAKNYDGNDLELMISTDYDGASEPTEPDFHWVEITDMFDWSTGGYVWTPSGEVDITNYTGEYFYIAFVYTSTDEAAAAWEVDDVQIIARNPLSINENPNVQLVVSPNPARELVSFNLESDAQVNIFDMTGRMVSTMAFEAGQAQVSVSELVNGVYFVNVRYADGTTAVSKFVKF